MSRPRGPISVATAVNYATGPKAGTPTRIDPGGFATAQGYYPGNQQAAQVANFWQGSQGDYVAYLDQIDLLNWAAASTGLTTSAALVVPSGPSIAWQGVAPGNPSVNPQYWLPKINTGQIFFSRDLANWTSDTGVPSVGSPIFSTVLGDPNRAVVVVAGLLSGSTASICFKNVTATWSQQSAGTMTEVDGLGFDQITGQDYYLYGYNGGIPGPQIFRYNSTTGSTFTQHSVTLGGTIPNTAIYLFACSSVLRMAIARKVGSNSTVWTDSDLTQTWANQGTFAFGSNAVGLCANDSGLFMVTADTGNVYTSNNGSSWTLAASTGKAFLPNCLVCRGSAYIAATSTEILISVDDGSTWRGIPIPSDVIGGTPVSLSVGDSRVFGVTFDSGTSKLLAIRSMRSN